MEKRKKIMAIMTMMVLIIAIGLVLGHDMNPYVVCQDDVEVEVKENIHIEIIKHGINPTVYVKQEICRQYKITNQGEIQAIIAEAWTVDGDTIGKTHVYIDSTQMPTNLFWIETEEIVNVCWEAHSNSPPGKAKLRFRFSRVQDPWRHAKG